MLPDPAEGAQKQPVEAKQNYNLCSLFVGDAEYLLQGRSLCCNKEEGVLFLDHRTRLTVNIRQGKVLTYVYFTGLGVQQNKVNCCSFCHQGSTDF